MSAKFLVYYISLFATNSAAEIIKKKKKLPRQIYSYVNNKISIK